MLRSYLRLAVRTLSRRNAFTLINAPGLSPPAFIGTRLGALAVAVAAVSVQALRTARVSPAEVLRSE